MKTGLRTWARSIVVAKSGVYGIDWLQDVKRLWSSGPSAIIMDVGANVGRVTYRLAKTFPSTQIHAFEPIGSSREALARAVVGRPNVTVHACALGAAPQRYWMTAAKESETNRILSELSVDSAATEQVEGTTVDRFLSGVGDPVVGLIKIDTEGYDLHVLEGAARTLEAGRIDLVVVECTFNPRGAPHVDAMKLILFMRALRYEVVAAYSHNVGRFVRGAGHSDVLFAYSRSTEPPR